MIYTSFIQETWIQNETEIHALPKERPIYCSDISYPEIGKCLWSELNVRKKTKTRTSSHETSFDFSECTGGDEGRGTMKQINNSLRKSLKISCETASSLLGSCPCCRSQQKCNLVHLKLSPGQFLPIVNFC